MSDRFDTYKEKTQCQATPQPSICNTLELEVKGMPFLKADYTIPDPKDIVVQAMGNVGNLDASITARTFDVATGAWLGSNADVVQALAIPVFMVENAVEGMEDAKELGEEVEKKEAESTLLTILSLIFFIVPFLGQAAAVAAGLLQLGRIIAIAGLAANAGLTIKEVIENPEMAPFAILELLTAGRLKTPKQYLDAANFRRAMQPSDIASLGENFAKQDGMIQKIVSACRK